MKSFHLSGPKFDIAAEMFCVVEFSIRSEICRSRIRMNAKISPKKVNFVKGAHL